MEGAFLDFINQFGYLAVSALILFENVFPPIPSELILPMGGFLVHETAMELPGVIVAATVGSVAGAFILYGVGRLLSRERLTAFFETKPMRLLGFKGTDVSSAITWFDQKGQVTVLICRCVPVVRSLISIPAGTAKMSPVKFALYTLVGSAVWNSVLCALGYGASSAWKTIAAEVEWVSDIVKYVILAVAVVAAVLWVVKRVIPNLRGREE
ncbi:DedA family protein [uncultured Parolsenella sp.]|uniref:DedA family protein n=1 Tax=uncultured Parolsenella sp. TaxID=2083008 RepID=UPI0025EB4E0B|nr:DedA family protein [uncultured Parolsenella sp.]